MKRKQYIYDIMCIVFIICIISAIIFRKYIFSGYPFWTTNGKMCSDLLRINYPTYVNIFDNLKNGWQWWSWNMGIGTTMVSHIDCLFDPFTYICFIGGRNNIDDLMIYILLVKIVFEGISFSFYVRLFVKNSFSIVFSSVAYAFCGYSLIMGTNLALGTVLVYMPLILLEIEKMLDSNIFRLQLIFPLFGVACLSFYCFFQVGILSAIYCIIRSCEKKKNILKSIGYLAILGAIVFLLASFTLMPQLAILLQNTRVNSGKDIQLSMELFLPQIKTFLSLITRSCGLNLLGNGITNNTYAITFNGVCDYYQNEIYVTSMAIPLIFQYVTINRKNKRKIWSYVLCFLFMSAFPIFSYIMNAFSTLNERWLYIFHIIICVIIALSIDKIIENKRVILKKLLFSYIFIFFVLKYSNIIFSDFNSVQENKLSYLCIFLIYACMFFISLFFNKFNGSKRVCIGVACAVFTLFICETYCNYKYWFGYEENLYIEKDSNNNYFDDSLKIIEKIQANDKSFYRIYKDFDSVYDSFNIPSNNDAMIQGYKGIKCYNSQNNPSYVDFLQKLGVYVGCNVDYVKFRNENILPENLTGATLNYINGIDDKYSLLKYLNVKYILSKEKDDEHYKNIGYKFLYSENSINVYENSNINNLIYSNVKYVTYDEFIEYDFDKRIEILEDTTIINEKKLNNNNSIIKTTLIEEGCDKLIFDTYISDGEQYICFSIPYDRGWTAYVDDKKIEVEKINIGLSGIKVLKGNHRVCLKYKPVFFHEGIIMTLLGAFIILIISLSNYIKKVVN